MPNWCENTLTITCEKKHKKELQLFKELSCGKGIIKKNKLEAERTKWLKVHEGQFKREMRLSEWVRNSTMPVNEFFTKVLGYEGLKNGDIQTGKSDMSMQNIMPCPTELLSVTCPVRAENGENENQFQARVTRHKKQYGHEDWHSWKCANWGCKWDVDATIHSSSATQLIYQFDSAWSPPTNFIKTASEKFPNLQFELQYEEPGNCFKGTADAENGEMSDNCEDYTPTCSDCGGEYDDEGMCPCEKEHQAKKKKAKV